MVNPTHPADGGGQLSLFHEERTLPVPGWRGRTPPEMRADAPEGYRLDISRDEPAYILDDDQLRPERDECLDEGFKTEDGLEGEFDGDIEPDGDDEVSADQERYTPREWALYCADTIGMTGKIRRPAGRLGALWVCIGGGGRAIDRDKRTMTVYRVVPLIEYRSPHPDLPLSYREHTALPDDHPFRYGYEGMLVTWQKKPHVLTDEHKVYHHPYIPDPDGHGYTPDPEWFPHDEDAVRSDRNPWREDPDAWQPQRRLI
ncbi:MAG: hypothetical protein IT302_08550 [Dehalococcoidia bacterium]|nr:hypothetical protein [Dehalococcoidia bacterium]